MQTIAIDLGTNISREASLRGALGGLLELLEPRATSRIYRTAPVGIAEQPDFFNMAVLGETELSPTKLRERFQEIEDRLGRDRTQPRYGPRTIDIDLLLYGSLVDVEQRLPHPQLLKELFVVAPLVELCPEGSHPYTGEPWGAILARLLDGRTLREAGLAPVGGLELLSLPRGVGRRFGVGEF